MELASAQGGRDAGAADPTQKQGSGDDGAEAWGHAAASSGDVEDDG